VDDHDHHTRGCHKPMKFRKEEVLMDLIKTKIMVLKELFVSIIHNPVTPDIPTTMNTVTVVFWDVMPSNLVCCYQCFGQTYRLHHVT
jgi:hypothetical protein